MNRLPATVQRHHQVIGPPVAVKNAIQTAQRRGTLVRSSPTRWINGHQVVVDLVLLEPAPKPRARRALIAAAATAGIAALAGATYAVYAAVAWAVTHWQLLLGAALTAVALLWWLVGRLGACPGLHCPGCKCR